MDISWLYPCSVIYIYKYILNALLSFPMRISLKQAVEQANDMLVISNDMMAMQCCMTVVESFEIPDIEVAWSVLPS